MLVVLDSLLILRVVVSNYSADESPDRRLGHTHTHNMCIIANAVQRRDASSVEQSFYVALLNAQQ